MVVIRHEISRKQLRGTVHTSDANGDARQSREANPKERKNSRTNEVTFQNMTVEEAYLEIGAMRDDVPQVVESKYHDLLKQYHPDHVTHLGKEFQIMAEEKTKRLNQAYQIVLAHIHKS